MDFLTVLEAKVNLPQFYVMRVAAQLVAGDGTLLTINSAVVNFFRLVAAEDLQNPAAGLVDGHDRCVSLFCLHQHQLCVKDIDVKCLRRDLFASHAVKRDHLFISDNDDLGVLGLVLAADDLLEEDAFDVAEVV